MSLLPAACYGKIQSHGDFVRHAGEVMLSTGLEAWLDEGLEAAHRHLGDAQAVHKSLVPMRLLWLDPGGRSALAGVMVPSCDKVGRRYPLVMVAPTPLGAMDLGAVLAATQSDIGQIEAVIDVASRGLDLGALRVQVDSLRLRADLVGSGAALDRYAESEKAADFGMVVGAGGDPVQWVNNLRSAVGTDQPPQFVVTATGNGKPETLGTLARCVQRAAKGRMPRLLVWDRTEPSAERSVKLRVLFDECHPRYFIGMAFPEFEHDLAWDVTPRDEAAVPIPDTVAATFAPLFAGDAPIASVLAEL